MTGRYEARRETEGDAGFVCIGDVVGGWMGRGVSGLYVGAGRRGGGGLGG